MHPIKTITPVSSVYHTVTVAGLHGAHSLLPAGGSGLYLNSYAKSCVSSGKGSKRRMVETRSSGPLNHVPRGQVLEMNISGPFRHGNSG